MSDVSVVIPTRSRPEKLERCLTALAAARQVSEFECVVADSTPDPTVSGKVAQVCSRYRWVKLARHDRLGVAAARNVCAVAASGSLLVNVDDDIQVEPEAVSRLISHLTSIDRPSVVAGSVRWGAGWSTPVKMRWIGYGRPAQPGEEPDFLIGAFFAYKRELALRWPWNEAIRTSDDRFMGAVWRHHAVSLRFEPEARAVHDTEIVRYDVDHQESHAYALLFDAVLANPSMPRAVSYCSLGVAAGLRRYGQTPRDAARYVQYWTRGARRFWADREQLRSYLSDRTPSR